MQRADPETNRVGRWGHSLAIRISAKLAKEIALTEGSVVELTVEDSKLVVSPAAPASPRYDLAQLVAGIAQDNLHEEADLGDPTGSELI
jgi:antitoxin MazE